MKLLSILIPVYNTEKYLKRCLDSILSDEIIDKIEIIIVNDGSKDNSASLIKEYVSKYRDNIIFMDKENGGHGSTINYGIKVATGKYFRVLDSDDWFDTAEFINFVKKLSKYNEDVIISSYTQEYVYSGETIMFNYGCFAEEKCFKFEEIDFSKLDGKYFTMSSSTYKLDLLRESKLQLFEKTFYVDMQYNIIPILHLKTVRFTSNNIYRYFIGRKAQSMSRESLMKNYPHHEKVMKYLVDYFVTNEKKLSINKKYYIQNIINNMLWTHYNIICNQIPDRILAFKNIKKFDTYLKKSSAKLYKNSNNFSYIRLSRHFKFLNVLFFNKIFNIGLCIFRKSKGEKL